MKNRLLTHWLKQSCRWWIVGALSLLNASSFASPEIGFVAELTKNVLGPDASSEEIEHFLNLTHEQAIKVDPFVSAYLQSTRAARSNKSLSPSERKQAIDTAKLDLGTNIRPVLRDDQQQRLSTLLERLNSDGTIRRKSLLLPLISLTYDRYFPSDGTMRSIFGSSPASLSIGISELESQSGERTRISYSTDTLSIGGSTDKLFVFSPQVALEYQKPLIRNLRAYGRISGGPAYYDYSFNLPSGMHLGAKRFGADGELEVGLRNGRFELSAEYRVLSQPAGINFDGFQLGLTYVVVHF